MTANAPAPQPFTPETRVLQVIRLFLREIGSQRASDALSMQASLERNLGLGSLERVELIDRLEREFAIQLPEQVLTEAETPADLVGALMRHSSLRKEGEPSTYPKPFQRSSWTAKTDASQASAAVLPESERPSVIQLSGVETLNEALFHHARLDPSRLHVRLYREGDEQETISYAQLLAGSLAVSAGLADQGLQAGQTAALMLPTGKEFFFAFLGILLAGGIPVPIYPPFKAARLEEYAKRQSHILQNAGVRFLITFPQAERLAKLLKPSIPSLKGVFSVADLSQSKTSQVPAQPNWEQTGKGGSVALIQYTSGSTGDPKGVVLTQSNLIANIRAIGAALELRPSDTAVSWLPLYHDMGLIGSWLCALYFGVPIVILSPLAFLSRPERWLWAIHDHRATVSPAPNFAYELCARKIDDRAIEGLDLSCWRVAFNGAEPISPDTLERFSRRFQRYGFRAETFLPGYGLAESSVALTFPPLGRKPRVDSVERERFEKSGEARPCPASAPQALRFVSEGRALPDHQIRLVDDAGLEIGERQQGHIQFRGPSTMLGYFRNPAATNAAMQNGWVKTGDLGYIADGELFVTGRSKDIILKGGRNLYPQEVEEVASEVAGVRRGCVAAFGLHDASMGTEKLVVVAETRETGPAARDRIASDIVARVDEHLGLPPDVVRLVGPHIVPKTSSGKIRRDACKQMYLHGELERKVLPAWLQVSRLALLSSRARARRAAARAWELLYGMYVWLVVALVLMPGWLLVLLQGGRNRTTRSLGILRFMCRTGLRLLQLEPRVEGRNYLEEAKRRINGDGQSLLLVSNHASYLDPVVVSAVCPFDFCFVSKVEAASWPIIGTFVRKCGFLTVNREDPSQSARVSERIGQRLKQGIAVHVFPEATFTPAAGLRPFQMGAFKSAVDAHCPILPVTLAGTRQVFRDGTWLPRHARVRVTVSPPIWPQGDSWREMVRLRDTVREEFLKHCGESPLDLMLAGPPR
ncbi:MAG TPA: AMP-binding protein [Terriglobia bacterium]|nr:AMP-binding protein [Terriglobia bacterium]